MTSPALPARPVSRFTRGLPTGRIASRYRGRRTALLAGVAAVAGIGWFSSPMVHAQTTTTLDGTSGSNTSNDTLSTTGDLTVNLGFFVDYLVVAGGGGGAGMAPASSENAGGGGGAGGLVSGTVKLVNASYDVEVGDGGAGGLNTGGTPAAGAGKNGGDSTFAGIVAGGGGGGGTFTTGPTTGQPGKAGGSGGGGGLRNTAAGGSSTQQDPSIGTGNGYGNPGGAARDGSTTNTGAGGGGGGAGSAGQNGSNSDVGGNGGDGLESSITGTPVVYAGGGGGAGADPSAANQGSGGVGGGGDANGALGGNGESGTDGLGAGGGASRVGVGGDGGSGIVIVRYEGPEVDGAGGTVTTVGNSTVHTFTDTGTSAFDLEGLDLNARLGHTHSGVIEGNGNFEFAGPGRLTLTGENTYADTTTISGGTLEVGNGGTTGNLSNAGITNNSALVFNRSDELTQGGVISGTGSVTQAGSGTTILTGDNTYTGTTTVSSGTLIINGNQTTATGDVVVGPGATLGGSGIVGGNTVIHGTHSVGNSPGIQTFVSDLNYSSGSSVLWELTDDTITQNTTTPLFDQIVVGGDLTFSGATTLTLDFYSAGTSLVDWDDDFWGRYTYRSWLLYDVAGTTTGFDKLTLDTTDWLDGNGSLFSSSTTIPNGSYFSLTQVGNDIYLNYSGVPEPTTAGLLGVVLGGLTLMTRGRRRLVSAEE